VPSSQTIWRNQEKRALVNLFRTASQSWLKLSKLSPHTNDYRKHKITKNQLWVFNTPSSSKPWQLTRTTPQFKEKILSITNKMILRRINLQLLKENLKHIVIKTKKIWRAPTENKSRILFWSSTESKGIDKIEKLKTTVYKRTNTVLHSLFAKSVDTAILQTVFLTKRQKR